VSTDRREEEIREEEIREEEIREEVEIGEKASKSVDGQKLRIFLQVWTGLSAEKRFQLFFEVSHSQLSESSFVL